MCLLGVWLASESVRASMDLFERAPFAAVVVAGFTPVPFFPVRFLVVMTGYPRLRYLAGVALSRTPRFFVLAAFGSLVDVPGELLVGLMVVMLVTVNVPALVGLARAGSDEGEEGMANPPG